MPRDKWEANLKGRDKAPSSQEILISSPLTLPPPVLAHIRPAFLLSSFARCACVGGDFLILPSFWESIHPVLTPFQRRAPLCLKA